MKLPHVPAVTLDEIRRGIEVGSAAGGRSSQTEVAERSPRIQFDRAEYALTDKPLNRFMMAVKSEFPDRFWPIMSRILALFELVNDPRMDQFSYAAAEGTGLHHAVLEIAAVMPLNPKRQFNAKVFFERVKRRWDEWPDEDPAEQPTTN